VKSRDGLVVHVREVGDVVHLPAADIFQRTAQDVHRDERPEVADMPAGIHGKAARIHAHRGIGDRRKLLLLARERVVETHAESAVSG
jgi:hypothetical protein